MATSYFQLEQTAGGAAYAILVNAGLLHFGRGRLEALPLYGPSPALILRAGPRNSIWRGYRGNWGVLCSVPYIL